MSAATARRPRIAESRHVSASLVTRKERYHWVRIYITAPGGAPITLLMRGTDAMHLVLAICEQLDTIAKKPRTP